MRITKKELQEMEARDRRVAAIHEYGHAIVFMSYGMQGSVSIWRNDTSDPLEEKLWSGQARYERFLSSPSLTRQISIAGFLAERIADEGTPKDFSAEELCFELGFSLDDSYDELGDWSYSDWRGAQGWEASDVAEVLDIFQRHWKALENGVESLVREAEEDGECAHHTFTEWNVCTREIGLNGQTAKAASGSRRR